MRVMANVNGHGDRGCLGGYVGIWDILAIIYSVRLMNVCN